METFGEGADIIADMIKRMDKALLGRGEGGQFEGG